MISTFTFDKNLLIPTGQEITIIQKEFGNRYIVKIPLKGGKFTLKLNPDATFNFSYGYNIDIPFTIPKEITLDPDRAFFKNEYPEYPWYYAQNENDPEGHLHTPHALFYKGTNEINMNISSCGATNGRTIEVHYKLTADDEYEQEVRKDGQLFLKRQFNETIDIIIIQG